MKSYNFKLTEVCENESVGSSQQFFDGSGFRYWAASKFVTKLH